MIHSDQPSRGKLTDQQLVEMVSNITKLPVVEVRNVLVNMISCYPQHGEDKLTSQQLHESAQEFLRPKMSFEDWQAFFDKIEVVKTVAYFMYGEVPRNASVLLAIYNQLLTERNFWDKCPGCGE